MSEIGLSEREVYTEDLIFNIEEAFKPIKLLFELTEGEAEEIAIIGGALYERAITMISEVLDFVEGEIGRVEIIRACTPNSKNIPVETMLSVKIYP